MSIQQFVDQLASAPEFLGRQFTGPELLRLYELSSANSPAAARDRIVRPQAAAEQLGVGMTMLYDLASKGLLPRPLKINPKGRASGWLQSEIDAWLAVRAAERLSTRTATAATENQRTTGGIDACAHGPAPSRAHRGDGR